VRLYCSGGLYGEDKSIDDLVAEMVAMADTGFSICKLKVGALSRSADLERVRAVLAAVPDAVKLIIDGVYSYSVKDAQLFFDELPGDRIEAFQSPIAADNIQGMSDLNSAGIPVMATEAEYRDEIHRQLIASRAITFLQTAPIASGGVSRVNELCALVEGTSIRLSLEVSSTAVALMAACHMAAAKSAIAHVEFHSLHQVFFESLDNGCRGHDPDCHTLPDEPGLGMSLPFEKLEMSFVLEENR
jgi:L-alanine-DL-glutamate epimerase-like enolase superfamily enzyme